MKKMALYFCVSLLLLAFSTVLAAGSPLAATLTGAAEVNAVGDPNQGDPDGTGTARLQFNEGEDQICFEITVSGITLPAAAAHIHKAPAGTNGPIVVPLTAPDATGVSSGCVSADPELIKAIGANPADYYVNVHTSDFPAGALRGQLSDAETDIDNVDDGAVVTESGSDDGAVDTDSSVDDGAVATETGVDDGAANDDDGNN